jgi:hypothetical protein
MRKELVETQSRLSDVKTQSERDNLSELVEHIFDGTVPKSEIHANLPVFMRRQELSRIMFIEHIYKKILNVHGYILEFGVRYGANLALYSNFRGMYEPYNISRKIIGFDTFDGFVGSSEFDKELNGNVWADGDYGVPEGHARRLQRLLELHESFSPIAHVKKSELRIGDVRETLPKFLTDHPETIVSLAYFDMDIYAPTKEALRLIKGRLHKGSVLVFDELCCDAFPGETTALLEEMDLSSLRLQRYPHQPYCSYAVIE